MDFDDIKEVVVAESSNISEIIAKDDRNSHCIMGFKYSYIMIRHNEENIAFIHRAWGGPISEKRGDFFYILKN